LCCRSRPRYQFVDPEPIPLTVSSLSTRSIAPTAAPEATAPATPADDRTGDRSERTRHSARDRTGHRAADTTEGRALLGVVVRVIVNSVLDVIVVVIRCIRHVKTPVYA
jgi:hypothetical protein